MTQKIHLNVTIELTTTEKIAANEMASLAEMHVKNCIMDNPDADNCTITDVDVYQL